MNDKIIKEMFDKKISKEEIYNKVFNKKINYFKYMLVPVCVILIICILEIKPNNFQNNSNVININEVNGEYVAQDIAWELVEISKEELNFEHSWLNYINEFKLYKINNYFNKKEWSGNYLIILDNMKTEIYISPDSQMKPRCVRFPLNNLKDSIINDIPVKINKITNKGYISLLKKDNLYYDIESYDITQKKFINLIDSITK